MIEVEIEAHTEYINEFRYFDADAGGACVQFRLIYQGPLPAEGKGKSRPQAKHDIRKQLHCQLRQLWNEHPVLLIERKVNALLGNTGKSNVQYLGERYSRGSFHFVPLVREETGATCSLDILFLRRDFPGSIVTSGGDIDNRIKVLFDALRVPSTTDGLPSSPDNNEHPFYCLLEDDSLITEVKVTTDRLLVSPEQGENAHNVHLVLNVRTNIQDYNARVLNYWENAPKRDITDAERELLSPILPEN